MSALLKRIRRLRGLNWPLMLVVLALLAVGVMFIYSACYISEDLPVRTLYLKQLLWIAVGMAGLAALATIDYRALRKVAWWAYAFSLALLVAVLAVGVLVYGARRRLDIAGVSVQPSEVAKLCMIILLASELSRPGTDVMRLRTFLGILALMAVPFLLVARQPDLGTAMVFVPVAFAMLFAAGAPLRYLMVPIGAGALGVLLLLALLLLPDKLHMSPAVQHRLWEATHLSEYQKDRILVYMGLVDDPLGVGWNKMQAEIAVGSGGVGGKGYLKGTQNSLGFLPRSVAPTDFIYSVVAEETGFVGSTAVLLLFGILILMGCRIAVRQQDKMGRLLCVGVVTMIFCHVFVNVAMTVGLMPITGLPLPLLSYGGSFTVVTLVALGLLQSAHVRTRRPVVFDA